MKYLKWISLLILIGLISLAFRSGSSIIDHPIIEDAYYTFSVTKNIANGNGISADGETPTNGFQPLYTFLIAPSFAIMNNDYFSIRIIFILSLLIYFSSAFLFASILSNSLNVAIGIEKRELFWLGFLVYIASVLMFINYLNGLETGLMLFGILVLIKYYQKINILKTINVFVLGIILGFLVLTRIDTVFLVIIISVSLLFRKELSLKIRFLYALFICIISFLISSPWWFYNFYHFGSIMPTSGQAQFGFELSMTRLFFLVDSVGQNLAPYTYTFDRFLHGWIGALLRLTIVSAFIILLWNTIKNIIQKNNINNIKLKRFVESITILIILSVVLSIWYFLFSTAGHFYLRYLAPLSIAGLLIFVLLLTLILKQRKILFNILITGMALLVLFVITFFHTGIFQNKSQFFKYQLQLVSNCVPKNEYVAAGQSGTLGFFRDKVVNMDGKVNNEVLKYKGRAIEYLEKKRIHWLCDWKFFTDLYLGKEPEKKGWRLVSKYGEFYLYHKSTE